MANKTIEEVCREVIVDQLSVDAEKVTSEAHFVDDLGADSLDTVELVVEIEDRFDIQISDEEAKELTTFGAAVALVCAKLSKNPNDEAPPPPAKKNNSKTSFIFK